MALGRQSQRAGSGSTQYQAGENIVVVEGITEARARKIAHNVARDAILEHARESQELVQKRIDRLDDKLFAVMLDKGRLGSFSDPAFLRSYRQAQVGAAASERETDYEILSALLAHRAENPKQRTETSGIDRAIQIADQVDEEALRGVTVFLGLTTWRPTTGDVGAGIAVMEKVVSKFLDGSLPLGSDWLDHLDILDVARLNTSSNLKSFDEWFAARLPGYVAPGTEKDHAPSHLNGDYAELPWGSAVVDHELRPGFVRINVGDESIWRNHLSASGFPEQLIEAFIASAKEQFGFGAVDPEASAEYMRRVREQPTLGRIAEWWAQIPYAVQLTPVGRALARANAFRLDPEHELPRD